MNKTLKGFTIIEVVLVLAIAGLIFLMVFIALPALRGGQRDQARKNDASLVSAAVTNYISNNRGAFPTETQLRKYVKSSDLSSNTTAEVTVNGNKRATTPITVTDGAVVVRQAVVCGEPDASDSANNTATHTVTAGREGQFVVLTWLEGGGGVAYCLQGS